MAIHWLPCCLLMIFSLWAFAYKEAYIIFITLNGANHRKSYVNKMQKKTIRCNKINDHGKKNIFFYIHIAWKKEKTRTNFLSTEHFLSHSIRK